MTGQIIENGVSNFTPIISRLTDIASEFIPYMLYIAIYAIGIVASIQVVKYIIEYLSLKSMKTYRYRENRYRKYKTTYEGGQWKNGVFQATYKNQYIRKKPKWYQF